MKTAPAPPMKPAPAPPMKPAPAARSQPAPLPFDATLGSILYSADRRLAIIDGRIVGVGDQIKGAVIVDITASAVLLRDSQGRLRQLTLSAR